MKSIAVLLLFLFCSFHGVHATTHIINFSYPSYSPSGLSVLVGDTILWKGPLDKFPLASTAVPVGAAVFGTEKGEDFRYVVTTAGTYKYQCPTYKADGMTGYFIALVIDKNEHQDDNSMVFINFVSHAFHLTTTDVIPHGSYSITVASVSGEVIYKSELTANEKDKWIATETFPPGTYILTATDGTHSFGRRFTK